MLAPVRRSVNVDNTARGEALGCATLQAGFANATPFERVGLRHRFPQPYRESLLLGRQNHPESRTAAHHPLIGLACSLERKDFIHGSHARELAEPKRVL